MIEIIHAKEQDDNLLVYFKITIDEETFEWHGSCPKDAEPKAYFEAIQDKIHFLILQKMYQDGDTWADWKRFKTDENTNLAAFQKWITEGCKNQIIVGYYKNGKPKYEYRVIEKKPWKSTHPPELAMTDKIDSLTVNADLKSLLKDIIMR